MIGSIFHYEDGKIFEEIFNFEKTIPIKIYLSAGGCKNFHSDFFSNLERFREEISFSPSVTTKLKIFEGEYRCSAIANGDFEGFEIYLRLKVRMRN